MGIFTGIEVLFFCLGALFVLLTGGLVYLKTRYDMSWPQTVLGGAGVFMTLFCIAWSVSSLLEGEPQAANMGLIMFGLPALLISASLWRSIKKQVVS